MSKSLNLCQFIGNLGQDPETRYLPDGKACTNITIACSDDYVKDGEKVEQTEWVRVSAFGKLAEIMAEYLKKGSKVYISGKMKTRSYEQDGVKKYATEIQAREMLMLDSRSSGSVSDSTKNGTQAPQQDSFDDDMPFN